MVFRKILFSDLQNLLLKWDFVVLPTTGPHYTVYYANSQTFMVLRNYEQKAYVDRTYLVAVRRILLENGLIDERAFEGLVEKVPD